MIVELYKFEVTLAGVLTVYRWTNDEDPVDWNGQTWTPNVVGRRSIAIRSAVEQDGLAIELENTSPIADLYRTSAPASGVAVTIYRGDTDNLAGTMQAFWRGKVSKSSMGVSGAEIPCLPELAATRRTMPHGRYSSTCRWALFSQACGVSQVAYTVACDVTVVDYLARTATLERDFPGDPQDPSLMDGWARGGYLQFGTQKRLIMKFAGGIPNQAGDRYSHDVLLERGIEELQVGDSVDIYPGCGHTMSDCKDKFDNLENYGGFPAIPRRNPFGGLS